MATSPPKIKIRGGCTTLAPDFLNMWRHRSHLGGTKSTPPSSSSCEGHQTFLLFLAFPWDKHTHLALFIDDSRRIPAVKCMNTLTSWSERVKHLLAAPIRKCISGAHLISDTKCLATTRLCCSLESPWGKTNRNLTTKPQKKCGFDKMTTWERAERRLLLSTNHPAASCVFLSVGCAYDCLRFSLIAVFSLWIDIWSWR